MLFLMLVAVLILFVYYKLYLFNQFWKRKGIPYVKPCLFFGNLVPVVFRRKSVNDIFKECCEQFESHRYFGFYQFVSPSLVISDIELIKQVCVKNFSSFTDRPDELPKSVDPFWKKSLLHRDGSDWQDMRTILTPAFTSRKMKAMFHLLCECSERLVGHFANEKDTITLEMRDLFMRYSNDSAATCFFGVQCDSFKDEHNEFFTMSKNAFEVTGFKTLKFFGSRLNETLIKILGVTFFSKEVLDFFERIVKETIEYREKTELVRPDMIHLLKEAQKGSLRNDGDEDDGEYSNASTIKKTDLAKPNSLKKMPISDEDIVIQALTFFFGAYDAVSTTLCQLTYELAVNVDVQEKLLKEVDSTLIKCNGKITYDALMSMKYLDMAITETLRVWPPAAALFRLCTKPFVIEPILPHEKPFTVEPGTEIVIPSYAIHRSSKFFSNPDKFYPERFSDENKGDINQYAFQSFGIGPRNCIGNRFALMQMKTVMFSLLTRFKIVPVEKTVIPFVRSKDSVFLRSAHGYWFGLKRRTV